jgi:hypothetical protein
MRRHWPAAVLAVNTGVVTIRKVGLAARLHQGRKAGLAGGAAAVGGPQECALPMPGEPIVILFGPARPL